MSSPIVDSAAVRARLDALAKPPGSLGRLEDLAVRLCVAQGRLDPVTRPRRAVLFAGDHGVVASGVSAWPSAVTSAMIDAIRAGRASSSALARATDTDFVLVDVGSLVDRSDVPVERADDPEHPGFRFRDARVGAGTRDLSREPATTVEELRAAFAVGADEARRAHADGVRLVATGEMGIGNTTPATCLAALLTGRDAAALVGPGAGADDATLANKRAIVRGAVERARDVADEERAIAALSGHELNAMAGFLAESSRLGMSALLDGVIATAAALVAERLAPGSRARWIAAHRSTEPAHAALLDALALEPLLDWNLRLGEGSGALLAMPLCDAAAALVRDVATLEELGFGAGPPADPPR